MSTTFNFSFIAQWRHVNHLPFNVRHLICCYIQTRLEGRSFVFVSHPEPARLTLVTVLIDPLPLVYLNNCHIFFCVRTFAAGFRWFRTPHISSSDLFHVRNMYYTIMSAHRVGCNAIDDIYRQFVKFIAFFYPISPPYLSDIPYPPSRKTIWINLSSKSRRAIIWLFKSFDIQLNVQTFEFFIHMWVYIPPTFYDSL